MIKVKVKGNYQEILIKGHAHYDTVGKDIVCAAVSATVITSVNGIMRLVPNSISCDESDGKIMIKVLQHHLIVKILLINMIEHLKELADKYPTCIKILKEVD